MDSVTETPENNTDKLDVNEVLKAADRKSGVNNYQRHMLAALNRGLMKNIYAGTVDPVTIKERRAKNKRAKKSRKINRRK